MEHGRALKEFVGSLVVVYFAVSGGAMATGLVLAVFMIAMGGTILPMFTLARVATGRDEWEDGAYDFIAQILGGITAYGFIRWETLVTDAGAMTWVGPGEFTPYLVISSLFAGFLMMMVYDRMGAGWEIGILAWMMAAGGATISAASELGGMLITSGWTGTNMLSIFVGLISTVVGAYVAVMFGEKILGEEE